MSHLSTDFFVRHISKLVKLSPEVHGSWEKSWIMGLSCWFYSFPGIMCFTLLLNEYYHYPITFNFIFMEGILYTLTAFNSFLSDYVYIGIRHYSHAFDRIFATSSAISIFVKIFWVTFTILEFIMFCILWIIALSMLSRSRKSKTQNEFMFNHFLWHFVSSLGMCWIIWVQYLNLVTTPLRFQY